jgi:myosin-5
VSESAVENLINLPHLHEPAILFSLQLRYTRDDIYTYTGPILIAVNPFKRLQLYTQETLQIYYNSGLLKSQGVDIGDPLPPHVYAIADAAYRDMMNIVHGYGTSAKTKGSQVSANQSILISGESGAGKTESTKIVLKYLTTVGNNNAGPDNELGSIMDKVLQSNPILEAFGNAKTLRNDNSSRFGKFIELQFSKRGYLIGGSISTYLLEKVRLPWQQYGERNFHIFYQLAAGASEEESKRWKLNSIRDYEYTTKGSVFTLEGIDDAKEFEELKTALSTLNFASEDQTSLFDLVAGILHLGQLKFQSVIDGEGEGSKILDDSDCISSLDSFSRLCGLKVEDIIYTLSARVITAGGESYVKKLTPTQSSDARDALAKAIYGKMFDWIVVTINRSIKVEHTEVRATIGVLDIFGFECFTNNSFEQLCINYTNETLQQQFNQYIFKLEQQEYQREKIEWSFIEFPDNKDCLELIEHKLNGILAMLDDECRLPMSSDEKFAGRMYKAYAGNQRFSASAAQKRNFKFSVHHYAGPVEYSTQTFVDKNKDELPKEASTLLSTSSVSLLRNLFVSASVQDGTSPKNEPGKPHPGKSASTISSVGSQFKEQLHNLMESIYATSPHYIRCLKPNDKNIKDNFNRLRITEQLRYGGVLEAVRVARSGFPVRLIHSEFFSRYRMLTSIHQSFRSKVPRFLASSSSKNPPPLREECEHFLADLWQVYFAESVPDSASVKYLKVFSPKRHLERQNVQIGLTKIFLRKEAHDVLESLRFKILFIASIRIQASWRKFIVRNQFICLVLAARLLQRVTRGMFARLKARSIREYQAAVTIQSIAKKYVMQQKYLSFRYAVIKLQASFRAIKSVRAFRQIRKFKAVVKLQAFIRSKVLVMRFARYRWSLVKLQNRYRKIVASRVLKKLKLEAKDLGKLKQSNETLKKEIDEIKMKAAIERERLREEAELQARDLSIKMRQEEEAKAKVLLSQLAAKLEAEQKLREEAEVKLREAASTLRKAEEPKICQNCEDMTLRYQDALKKIVELEQLLEKERAEIRQKERAFLKESSLKNPVVPRRASLTDNSRGMGIAFIPVKEPTGGNQSPANTSPLDISTQSSSSNEIQNEFNKLRHANNILEQEVSRLRKLSLEQQSLLESRTRASSRDSPSLPDPGHNARRNSGRLKQPNPPLAHPSHLEIKSPSWNQAWDSEDDSVESESTTDQMSSHSQVLVSAAVTQTYEKNVESWKSEFYNGFKVKFWEVSSFP